MCSEVLLLTVSCSLKGSEEMFYERALSVFLLNTILMELGQERMDDFRI